jgi:hypothetical protein
MIDVHCAAGDSGEPKNRGPATAKNGTNVVIGGYRDAPSALLRPNI